MFKKHLIKKYFIIILFYLYYIFIYIYIFIYFFVGSRDIGHDKGPEIADKMLKHWTLTPGR